MPKDDSTWLNVGYVIFGVIIGYIGWNFLNTVGTATAWSDRFEWFDKLKLLVGVLSAFLGVYILRRDAERHEYLLSSVAEIRKVTWPTVDDTRKKTIVVCVVVGIFAFILAIFDIVWAELLKKIISLV